MDIKTYAELNEVIYSERLKNGLTVKLVPKSDYNSVYAVLFTEYGSIDHRFIPRGEREYHAFPYGVAHFLEHKLFETRKGDISQVFSSQGASVNAYTSNTKTAFLCSFTTNGRQNIETLLDFIQDPFFSHQSVEDEKSIISQEIQMYKDDPEWALTQGLIENLYPEHPVRIDVAGTTESVQSVTVEMLKQNYQTFYHPDNMQMIIVGNIDPAETLQWIKDNQTKKVFPLPMKIERRIKTEAKEPITKSREVHLSVNLAKVSVGVKGHYYKLNEREAFRHVICMEIILDLLFGETSATYLSLYNDNLIDDSFSYDYVFERGFDYVSIGGDSRNPKELAGSIQNILLNTGLNPDLTFGHYSIVKNKLIGEYIQDLNSLGYIAHQFIDLPSDKVSVFDYLSVLKSITFEELKVVAEYYFKSERISVFTVKPKMD
ncbi:M16 family metallopeptidase [Alkalibacterium putridalgicola]|uniref:EF-P 5-aminopentanol modification-associated protein YfmH n=1 Tax=Alkalibacterium putridalgicola TaxID=426703 RepID=UPI0034CF4F85